MELLRTTGHAVSSCGHNSAQIALFGVAIRCAALDRIGHPVPGSTVGTLTAPPRAAAATRTMRDHVLHDE
jgi:hypothetical protein